MGRVKLDFPDKVVYNSNYRVRINDINYGNHLSNDRVLVIAHQARLDYLKNLGYKNELDVEGNGIIVSDAAIVFKAESFEGDELKVGLGIGEVSRVGFDLYYRIVRKSDEVEIAVAKTAILFFDYSTRKVTPIPVGFKEKAGIT